MASHDGTPPSGSRREQRKRRRRGWRRRLLLGSAIALVVAGAAYAVTGPLRPGDDTTASRSHATLNAPTGAAEPAADHSCRSPLNPLDPLRLWIGGDSLAGSLAPSLGELTGKSGVVQPVVDSRVSSGLLSPNFLDWQKKGTEDMSTFNPEVAVFIIGANDAKNLPRNADQDPRWHAQYSAIVEQMVKVLIGSGRAVYWVSAPVMSDAAFSERVKGVNAVFQEVAANHPEVTYVDAFTVFSGPDGRFASMLPNSDGKLVRVRAQDGVHFTAEGGDVLAKTVFDQLDPQCKIMQQAVEGVTKPIIEVAGSSSVPGTRRRTSPAPTGSIPATGR